MTARLDITDNPGPCIALWGDSALGYTYYGPVRFESQDGRIWLVSDRPFATFSSGEKWLWDCLTFLSAGEFLTEFDITGCPDLDATNVRALRTAADLMAEVAVTFYRQWAAFPLSKMCGEADEIMVSVSPNGPNEGGNYEFGIEHVGTELGRRDPIALRVQLFTDSWRAFHDLPEFFDLLADLDESASAGRSHLSLDDLIPSLEAMGWIDRTDTFAERHHHSWGCLSCGERRHELATDSAATT